MRWSAAQTLAWIIQHEPVELKEWTTEMGPKIEPAAKTLATAIGADEVIGWGRATSHGSLEKIPGGSFRISGLSLIVGPHGDLGTSPRHKLPTYAGPRWHDIEFDADEIKREWPKPPPSSASDWMRKEAELSLQNTGQPGKRSDLVQRCMTETTCTRRVAEAAHKLLPTPLRRGRGKKGQ